MRMALALGARGAGRCWPNPNVGCVLVSAEGRVVGRGWTAPGGRPHAEPQALAQAGDAARGATAYVTLEPCCHHGETPPCCDALIAAGIARVVVPLEDSDPRVSGRGLDALRSAGVAVTVGICTDRAEAAHQGFFLRQELGRPAVTLKLATSLDGRIATATGESQWITGPQARRAVHAMRARHDAVLIGGGTARADDPSLSVRDLGDWHQPVRVVAARRLDLPLMGNLARSAKDQPLWILHGPHVDQMTAHAWAGLGARLIPVPLSHGMLDMAAALQALGQAGLNSVFCEGGGALAASLLQSGLADHLACFTAGLAIGAEGTPAIAALGLERLADAPRYTLSSSRNIGPDTLTHWTVRR